MAYPAQFLNAIRARNSQTAYWLEIEGLPICFGTFAQVGATWFAARVAAERFTNILSYFTRSPENFDQELDPLEGMAKTVAEVEFSILDKDDTITSWVGIGNKASWVYLNGVLSKTGTVISYTGDGSAIGSSGILYMGTETVTFTAHDTVNKIISGVTRAQYRSKAQEFPLGFPVAVRPYTMKSRRCWYYQVAIQPGETYSDANKALRFAGTLETVRSDPSNPAAYVLALQSMEKLLDREIFRELKTVRDTGGQGLKITDGTPSFRSTDASLYPAAWTGMFRVDDELMILSEVSGAVQVGQRGLCGTAISDHDANFTANEVVTVTVCPDGVETSYPPEVSVSKFGSTPWPESTLPSNHPLMVFLQVLMSTGTFAQNWPGGAQRNYDTLPETWGLGIDYSRVDVAGICAAAQFMPGVVLGGIIEKPVNFIEFAKSILRPFGFYALVTVDDQITVKYLRPPLPDETLRTVDDSIRINKSNPSWDSNLAGVVQEVELKHSYDVVSNRPRRIDILNSGTAKLFVKKQGRAVRYDSRLIYDNGMTFPGVVPRGTFDVRSMMAFRIDFFSQRYSRPPPIITERVDYSFLDVVVGELVAVSHSYLPNVATGARGMVSAVGEVIKKRVNNKSKTVELTLLMTGYQLNDYRFIAPSLEIETVLGAGLFTYKINAFTEPTHQGYTQDDARPRDSVYGYARTFQGDERIHIRANDFSTTEEAVIASIDFTAREISLTAAPVIALAVGQYICLPIFEFTQGNGLAQIYAHTADSSEFLLVSDPGHKLYP